MGFRLPVVFFLVTNYFVQGNGRSQLLIYIYIYIYIYTSEHSSGLGIITKRLFTDRPCNGTTVGRVTNKKLNELSGLVESHRFPGIFYSIEDSGNKNIVYVLNKNGTLRGKIKNNAVREKNSGNLVYYYTY